MFQHARPTGQGSRRCPHGRFAGNGSASCSACSAGKRRNGLRYVYGMRRRSFAPGRCPVPRILSLPSAAQQFASCLPCAAGTYGLDNACHECPEVVPRGGTRTPLAHFVPARPGHGQPHRRRRVLPVRLGPVWRHSGSCTACPTVPAARVPSVPQCASGEVPSDAQTACAPPSWGVCDLIKYLYDSNEDDENGDAPCPPRQLRHPQVEKPRQGRGLPATLARRRLVAVLEHAPTPRTAFASCPYLSTATRPTTPTQQGAPRGPRAPSASARPSTT